MNEFYLLVALSVLLNVILLFELVARKKEKNGYEDALNKIDTILSGLKKEPPPPPDPRKGVEWKVKR
jgi:hypothetical protein